MSVTVLRRHRTLAPAHVHQEPPAVTAAVPTPDAASDSSNAHLAALPAPWRTDTLHTAHAERTAYDFVHALATRRAQAAADEECAAALAARRVSRPDEAIDLGAALNRLAAATTARQTADTVVAALGPRPGEPADPEAGRLAAAGLERAAREVGTLARTRSGAELATWRAIPSAIQGAIAPPMTTPEEAATEQAISTIAEQAQPLDLEVVRWLTANAPATIGRLAQAAALRDRCTDLAAQVATVREQVKAADRHRAEHGLTWSHPDFHTIATPAVRVLPLRREQVIAPTPPAAAPAPSTSPFAPLPA